MNGKPDRRMILAGPFDTVFRACRNENVVALGQNLDIGLAFKTQPGRSGQDHNPFGPALIVPKPRWTRWPREAIRKGETWQLLER
jgi:hypothetical protein